MDSGAFLGLEQSHNPFRWTLDVRPEVCTSSSFLFGGAGLGAAIGALEGTGGRQCIWATSQYLSYARPGLDNTLRVMHLVPTDWVLLDIRVHGVQRGFGHGLTHMFAEDGKGTLLATASQSCIVRFHKDRCAVVEQTVEQTVECMEQMGGTVSETKPLLKP